MSVLIDPTIPSWATLPKLELIGSIAVAVDRLENPTILEVGSWAGRSLYCWAANAPSARVVSVDCSGSYTLTDLHTQNPDAIKLMSGDPDMWDMWDGTVTDSRKLMASRHQLANIEFCDMRSSDFFTQDSRNYDLIYIDGGHDTDVVSHDLNNAIAVLNKGGILCGDDYYGWQTVRDAVDPFIAQTQMFFKFFPIPDLWIMTGNEDIYNKWFENIIDKYPTNP